MTDPCTDAWRAMAKSPMNAWVGAGDPRVIGEENASAAERLLLDFNPSRDSHAMRHVLDYGAGIGRTTLALAHALPSCTITGVDIVPSLVGFCQRVVQPAAPDTGFICLREHHPLYQRLAGESWSDASVPLMEKAMFRELYRNHFDTTLVFSVLTHASFAMGEDVLGTLAETLAPGGKVVLSCFLATNRDPRWRVAHRQDRWQDHGPEPFGYVTWSLDVLTQTAERTGLRVLAIAMGSRDGHSGLHPHDLLLAEKT